MDPEDLYEVIGFCLKLLERTATEHGAGLVKSRGDGVLAVFGLPASIEAPARCAVNAAIEMGNRLAAEVESRRLAVPLELHSGVNTGMMVAGEVATGSNAEIDVVGDAVNVAARLSDMAPPGAIFVGDETFRATANEFRYRPAQRMHLKGRSESVPIYELLSRRSAIHRRTAASLVSQGSTLVDRRDEYAAIERCLEALAGGQGTLLLLEGEAGIGKSRLAAELRAAVQARGYRWLEGRSVSIGRSLSYHVFADALQSLLALPEHKSDGSALDGALEARLSAWLSPDEIADTLPFLGSVMGISLSPECAARVDAAQGDARERLIQMSLRLLFTRLATQQPLVFVLEDLHWADHGSTDLLASLLDCATRLPLMLVGIARPDPDAPALDALREAIRQSRGNTLHVELPTLQANDCHALVVQHFAEGALTRSAARRIADKSGGNPFFVEEVVRTLLDAGMVVEGPAGLVATAEIEAATIPDRVQDLVLQRIDRLPSLQRQVLQVAAVVGARFEPPILSAVLDKEDLEVHIEGLLDEGLLCRYQAGHHEELAFEHALVREVTYDSLLRSQRRELHRRVADAIEMQMSEVAAGYYGMLAYHCTMAEDPERAEGFLFRAGEEAARLAAAGDALSFFREASRVYLEKHGENAEPTKLAALEKRIALSLFYRGEFIEALDHFNRWLEHIGEKVPGSRLALFSRVASNVLNILSIAYFPGRLQRNPAADARQIEIITMMFDRARAQTTASPERFLIDSLENFRQLSRVDPTTVPGAGGMIASGGLGIFGFTGLSFAIGERLLNLAEPLVDPDDPREAFIANSMRYYQDCFRGNWDPSHELPNEQIEAALRLGEVWDVVTYLGVDGRKRLHQGRFAEAEDAIERLVRIEELYDYELARSSHNADRTLLLLEQDRLDEAASSAERYLNSTDEDLLNVLALSLLAKIHVLRLETDAAHVSLARARAIARKLPLLPPFHAGAFWRSQLLVDIADVQSARRSGIASEVRAALRAARRSRRRALKLASRSAWERTEILRLVADLEWLKGRSGAALVWYRRSLEAGRALDARPELRRTHLVVADRLGDTTCPVEELLDLTAREHRAAAESLARSMRHPRSEPGTA